MFIIAEKYWVFHIRVKKTKCVLDECDIYDIQMKKKTLESWVWSQVKQHKEIHRNSNAVEENCTYVNSTFPFFDFGSNWAEKRKHERQ